MTEGRPVLAREQLTALAKRIMQMTSVGTVRVAVRHTATVVTRLANGQVLSSDDGDWLWITLETRFGENGWGARIRTNQVDDTSLRAIVAQSEAVARSRIGFAEELMPHRPTVQDTFVPTHLWHDETVHAMRTTRGTVIPEVLAVVTRNDLRAAGFLGLMARSEAFITKEGIFAFSEETDAELTVSARTRDGTGSGWSGQASRNWATMRPANVAGYAIDVAQRSANPVAIEPGRRMAILTPAAVVQILRYLAPQFDAYATDIGQTGFSKPRGNKLGERVFDSRISMSSDPNDPDGGYCPYFGEGLATPAMSWVENGVLKNLAYDQAHAMGRGKAYAENPWSIRVSGGTATIEQMIAQCKEGIFVNRFSSVDSLDQKTGLTTGITRDGCFLVKDGKISRPIKNLRFLESPFFFLNRIEALGVPERAAFGYTPQGNREEGPSEWPRRPIIVPPMMLRDFNFSALEDAV